MIRFRCCCGDYRKCNFLFTWCIAPEQMAHSSQSKIHTTQTQNKLRKSNEKKNMKEAKRNNRTYPNTIGFGIYIWCKCNRMRERKKKQRNSKIKTNFNVKTKHTHNVYDSTISTAEHFLMKFSAVDSSSVECRKLLLSICYLCRLASAWNTRIGRTQTSQLILCKWQLIKSDGSYFR